MMNTRLRLLYLLNRKLLNENASVEKIKNEQIIFLCMIIEKFISITVCDNKANEFGYSASQQARNP